MEEIKDIKKIDFDFIIEYVQAQGPEAVQWLKDISKKPVPPGKSGKERNISFVELRKEFVLKFFPGMLRSQKEKKATMLERIAEL